MQKRRKCEEGKTGKRRGEGEGGGEQRDKRTLRLA